MTDRDSRSTQRGKILAILTNARGGWVLSPEIAACAAQYNARIFELRRMRFRIVNRTKHVEGVRHSWFKLETGPPPAKHFLPRPSPPASLPHQDSAAIHTGEVVTLPLFAGEVDHA